MTKSFNRCDFLKASRIGVAWISHALIIACTAGLATSCADSVSDSQTLVRDSAGVRIVENHRQEVVPRWSISSEPLLEIGGSRSRAGGELYGVADVVRSQDGLLAVADESKKIREFDPSGRLLREIGLEGGGPGEFRQVSNLVYLDDDSIAAWDPREQRLTVFDGSGSLARIVTPTRLPPGDFHPLYGIVGDGSLILGSGLDVASVFEAGTGVTRPEHVVAIYSPEEETLRTLASFPGTEQFAWVGPTGFSLRPRPFGRGTYVAAEGNRLYVATNERYEVRGIDLSRGEVDLILRLVPDRTASVTAADVDAYRRRRVEGLDRAGRDEELRRLDAVEYPKEKAPITGLVVGNDGRIWIRGQPEPTSGGDVLWNVFRDGALQGAISLPTDLDVQAFGDDWMVAVKHDELDVEIVQLFQLSPVK